MERFCFLGAVGLFGFSFCRVLSNGGLLECCDVLEDFCVAYFDVEVAFVPADFVDACWVHKPCQY